MLIFFCFLFQDQIRILHEIFLLKNTNLNNDESAKNYRLFVKKRLYKKYQDILSGIEDKEEKKKELHKMYEEVESEYKSVISKLK
jgi:hypothetical protein